MFVENTVSHLLKLLQLREIDLILILLAKVAWEEGFGISAEIGIILLRIGVALIVLFDVIN